MEQPRIEGFSGGQQTEGLSRRRTGAGQQLKEGQRKKKINSMKKSLPGNGHEDGLFTMDIKNRGEGQRRTNTPVIKIRGRKKTGNMCKRSGGEKSRHDYNKTD